LTALARTARAEAAFTPTEINHIVLTVTDVNTSKDFYTKLFGPPSGVFRSSGVFRFSSTDIMLKPRSASDHVGVDHVCLSVGGYDLESTAAKLKLNGVTPEYPYGPAELYFHDPDGILIQLERGWRGYGTSKISL
jgi:catechol 2,3-dioxygenase-like lactoylglutathione lyase family enzyme